MSSYRLYNPSGNITALVRDAHVDRLSAASKIFDLNPTCEQVGFVEYTNDGVKLTMSGDEFCGNASMCAAIDKAYAYEKDNFRYNVECCDKTMTVSGEKLSSDSYAMSITGFSVEELAIKSLLKGFAADYKLDFIKENSRLYKVIDIVHFVTDSSVLFYYLTENIKEICRYINAKALGVMFVERADEYKLTPVVYVPLVDTLFNENACASGTVAAGLFLGQKASVSFVQPGGSIEFSIGEDGPKLSEKIIALDERDL